MEVIRLVPRGDGHEGTLLMYQCPACGNCHGPALPHWVWNGDLTKPTISPSVLVRGGGAAGHPSDGICHHFIRDGNIEFCGDCTHAYAGRTVPLEPW